MDGEQDGEEGASRAWVVRGALFGALVATLTLVAGTTGVPVVLALPAAALCASVARGPGAHLVRAAASAAGAVVLARVVAAPWVDPPWSAAAAAFAGGLLGVAAVVPWRRLLVARERLPFAEGAACATLRSAPRAPGVMLVGLAAGVVLPALAAAAGAVRLGGPRGASGLAAGFLIGPRAACAVLAGALVALLLGGTEPCAVVAAGALAGAGLVVVARSLPAWRASRAEAAPYRVRFEIGGEGTRIEDMTPPADRDLGVVPRVALVAGAFALLAGPAGVEAAAAAALVVVVAAVLVPLAARAAGRVGMLLVPAVVLGSAVAVELGAAALGAGTFGALTLTAAVAVAVGADLAQSFAAGASAGVEPGRTARAALLGVLVAAALHAFAFPVLPVPWRVLGDLRLDVLVCAVPWGGFAAGVAGGAAAALVAPTLALAGAVGLFTPPLVAAAVLAGGLASAAVARAGGGGEPSRAGRRTRGAWFGAGLVAGEAALLVTVGVPVALRARDGLTPVLAVALLVPFAVLYARVVRGRDR